MVLFKRASKQVKEIETLVATHVRQGSFSGVVLVEKDGEVLFSKAYGMASQELSVPMGLDHCFNIGSVSKTFTAMAVFKLQQQGHLSIQDKLAKFVPELLGSEYFSLHHLLSNTSGLPDYLMLEGSKGWYTQPHNPAELLELICDEPRLFAPGERLGYSNTNWVLLVMVVERVTGKPWNVALRELVMEPHGLKHTTVGESGKVVPGRAMGYRLEGNQILNALPINPSVEIGAGGIFSTAQDLLKLERSLLQDPRYQQMIAPVAQDSGISYGYGLMSGERFARRWEGHSGGTFGFISFLTHYPSDNLSIIVLSNIENGSAMRLEQDLAAVVLGQPYTLPAAHQFVSVSPEMLHPHTGTYRSEFMGRPMNFEVFSEEGTLTVQFPLLPKAKLQALAENRFVGRIKGAEVVFVFKPGEVLMDWAGILMESPRVA